MRGWSVWLLMLTLVGCVSLGLAQPSPPGVRTFVNTASGEHNGVNWNVELTGEMDYVTTTGLISGGNNHVRVVDFEYGSSPNSLAFEIVKLEMKIGGISVDQWAPTDSADWKDINKYFPVRFASAKFAHGAAVPVEIKARFKVRLADPINSPWSPEAEVTASTSVTAHNVALNWQTTVNAYGNTVTGINSYPGQAQAAGNGQRPLLGSMKHRVDMPNPTNATASGILQFWMGQTTFLVPNTHGWAQGLWDSTTNDVFLTSMAAERSAAVAAGYPRANMALVMGCFSDQPLASHLSGSPEFANFGTHGLLWSLSYSNTAPPAASDVHPTRPTSPLYIWAVKLMSDGAFADEVPDRTETRTKSTFTENLEWDELTQEGWWIPINLQLHGSETQRPNHVFMDDVQRQHFYNIQANTALWYLVVDPTNLRGQ